MFRAQWSIALTLAMLVGGAPLARAAITTPYSPGGSKAIAQGVRHESGTLVTDSGSNQNVNVIEVDPSDPSIEIRLSQADGLASRRKLVTDQAHDFGMEGRRVVATVNGSTFFYIPRKLNPLAASGQGLNVSDGELINAGAPVGSAESMAFGIDPAGSSLIGNPQLEMQLTLSGGTVVDLTRINQRRLENDIVLLTSGFDAHTWTNDLGDEYVVEGFDLPLRTSGTYAGTVVAAHYGHGDNPIGPGQVVISVADGAAGTLGTLAVGDEVSLAISIDDEWQQMTNLVGGRNMLVVDGANVVSTAEGPHPRTAVGIKPDGDLILVTADGGHLDSGGLSLEETAQLMLSLGAVDAVNLDGGGSSQMAVRDPGAESLHFVNAVLTPREEFRPVSNALQVVSSGSVVAPDVSAPVVGEPGFALASVARVARSHARLDVVWEVSDESELSSVEVHARVGDSAWRALASGSPAASSVNLQVPYGVAVRVRVRATDSWGNASQWIVSDRVRVTVVDESDDVRVVRGGGWRRRSDSRSFGGAYRRSKTTSARAELTFDGYQVGLVGRVGPRGASAVIKLDGASPVSVATYSATSDYRRLLYLGPAMEQAADHLLELRNEATDQRPALDIDAFLILEQAP